MKKACASLLPLVLSLPACTSAASMVRARYAKEQGCSESMVRVDDRGAHTYAASGCGEEVRYVCSTFAGADASGRSACTRQDGTPSRGTPGLPSPRPEATLDPPH